MQFGNLQDDNPAAHLADSGLSVLLQVSVGLLYIPTFILPADMVFKFRLGKMNRSFWSPK
jgi:hypothetical protein